MAGGSADSAEIAQVQREARLYPPRENCILRLADVREQATETAKRNAKNLTQSRKEAKAQREMQLNRRDAESAESLAQGLRGRMTGL